MQKKDIPKGPNSYRVDSMLGGFRIEISENDEQPPGGDKSEDDIFSDGRKEFADVHYNAIDYGCCGDNLPLP